MVVRVRWHRAKAWPPEEFHGERRSELSRYEDHTYIHVLLENVDTGAWSPGLLVRCEEKPVTESFLAIEVPRHGERNIYQMGPEDKISFGLSRKLISDRRRDVRGFKVPRTANGTSSTFEKCLLPCYSMHISGCGCQTPLATPAGPQRQRVCPRTLNSWPHE